MTSDPVPTDLVRIGEACRLIGVSKMTLTRWHDRGTFVADVITPGGEKRYSRRRLIEYKTGGSASSEERKTIAYARVSTSEQKDDLERQKARLIDFCSARGWVHEVIADTGSGMNYRKRGLKRLLAEIVDGRVERLVIMHKDRLLRFGAELVFAICEARDVEIVVVNKSDEGASFEEELARDVLEIVTVFSARLYGARSRKSKALIDDLAETAIRAGA